MAIAPDRIVYSPEEFLLLGDVGRCELIHGQLKERPEMGAEAILVATTLLFHLLAHVRASKWGLCFGENCPYQCFPHDPGRVRKPDVSFVRAGRLPGDKPPRGQIRLVPDLIVEVVSPNDLAEDLDDRITDYLSAGVPRLWVVYPKSRHVQVYRRDGTSHRLGPGAELGGEDVVPGFALPLDELFAAI